MAYVRNQPIATDELDVSQPKLATNTNGADDAFGIDHYAFSSNIGIGVHNQVTTPQFSGNTNIAPTFPTVTPTTATNPILYAFQPTNGSGTPTTNLGLLQYSKGPSNATPTPLTTIQSGAPQTINNGVTINVFDFTGISNALAMAYAATTTGAAAQKSIVFVSFNNAANLLQIFSFTGAQLRFVTSGNILQLNNNTASPIANIIYTLQFLRVE